MWLLVYFGVQGLIAFAFCAAIGRWWAIIPPVLFWPVYWVGFKADWWGDHSGEAGALLGATVVLGVVVTALGGYVGVAVRNAAR
jgi:hypothetical protein